MKKVINLKSVKEFLTRDEMRVVKGGSGCFTGCWGNWDCWGAPAACKNCVFPVGGGGPGACSDY